MRVKKFVARTLPEALVQVKAELGPDAVILHTTQVKVGGFLGMFGSRRIEVMAAVEDRPGLGAVAAHSHAVPSQAQAQAPAPPLVSPSPAAVQPEARPAPRPAQPPQIAQSAQLAQLAQVAQAVQAAQAAQAAQTAQAQAVAAEAPSVQDDVADMKLMLTQIMQMVSQPAAAGRLEPELKKLLDGLIAGGLVDDVAMALVGRVRNRILKGEASWDQAKEVARQLLVRDISVVRTVDVGGRVVALVGPTGVGKTTTLAKLAAHLTLHKRKKIALITADTYRVAAVEQLKTYAEILSVPLEVVYDQREVKDACRRHEDKELILVDTAGRSPRNAVHMEELKGYLDELQPDDKYLVMSLTSGYRDAVTIVESYLPLGFDHFLFTKWDEAAAPGLLYNMVRKYKRPLSYITTGQNVPDDIAVADPETIIQAILGD